MGSGKVSTPQVFGCSKQLLLNKFFDPSTPSMRKVDDGERKKKKKSVFSESCLEHPETKG